MTAKHLDAAALAIESPHRRAERRRMRTLWLLGVSSGWDGFDRYGSDHWALVPANLRSVVRLLRSQLLNASEPERAGLRRQIAAIRAQLARMADGWAHRGKLAPRTESGARVGTAAHAVESIPGARPDHAAAVAASPAQWHRLALAPPPVPPPPLRSPRPPRAPGRVAQRTA